MKSAADGCMRRGSSLRDLGLGDTDEAFDWLEKSVEARDWQLGMLTVEPAFDGLRSDPRFAAMLERVGLPR